MKKTIRLTESDIQRLVEKIIGEQETTKKSVTRKELVQINIDKLKNKIKELQTKLDSYEKQLKSIR
jgi:Tfp pilus assembly protein PilO